MPEIDYGEQRFPISAWGMLVAQGLMTAEEAVKRTKAWLKRQQTSQYPGSPTGGSGES